MRKMKIRSFIRKYIKLVNEDDDISVASDVFSLTHKLNNIAINDTERRTMMMGWGGESDKMMIEGRNYSEEINRLESVVNESTRISFIEEDTKPALPPLSSTKCGSRYLRRQRRKNRKKMTTVTPLETIDENKKYYRKSSSKPKSISRLISI